MIVNLPDDEKAAPDRRIAELKNKVTPIPDHAITDKFIWHEGEIEIEPRESNPATEGDNRLLLAQAAFAIV